MDLQLIADGNKNLPIASIGNAGRFNFLPLSRRFLRIFAIATLPLYAVPSLAYTFPFDVSEVSMALVQILIGQQHAPIPAGAKYAKAVKCESE